MNKTTATTAQVTKLVDRYIRIRKVQLSARDSRKVRNCQISLDGIVLEALEMDCIAEFHGILRDAKS
jgi:hypothetical protein